MKQRRQLLGILLLILALNIILMQLNIIKLPLFLHNIPLHTIFWSLILGYLLIKSIRNGQLEVLFVCLFLLIYAFNGIVYQLPIPFWLGALITVLIYCGVTLIFPNSRQLKISMKKFRKIDEKDKSYHDNSNENLHYNKKFNVSFSEKTIYLDAQNYNTVKTNVSFGELQLFFDNTIQSQPVQKIHVNLSLAEMSIFVPKGWKVDDHLNVSLGEVVVKGSPENSDTLVTLQIVGNLSLAELNIIYV